MAYGPTVILTESGSPLVRSATFTIKEDDRHWRDVKVLIEKWKLLDFAGTEFSKQDLEVAAYLQMSGGWAHGYPQPGDNFAYCKITYDSCCTCGKSGKQIAPFRMKGEPKWGTRHVLQLNWVFDEFFVRPEIWDSVFKPFDIPCLPVFDYRTNKELRTVVQLAITEVAESKLMGIPADHPTEECAVCGNKKYHPITRGRFPPFAVAPSRPIVKTQEYFGSGGSAWHAVVVSADVYRVVSDRRLKGLMFVPLANRLEELITPLR